MKEKLLLCQLFDFYQSLLTEKQKNYFIDYFFDNLSFQEIAENNQVSRNAIYKQLKEVENKLFELEKKLKLLQKTVKIEKMVKDEKVKKEILRILGEV